MDNSALEITMDDGVKYHHPLPSESLDSSARQYDNKIGMSQILESISTVPTSLQSEKLELTVYGSNLKAKSPSRLGNLYTFLYVRGQPLIAIGPQCKEPYLYHRLYVNNTVSYCKPFQRFSYISNLPSCFILV